jgi:light-regulated signal transduction histidine kinase (bacteriophytochrome)
MQNLERSNKELEQFAYVASHDLQEPLRMVSSYTQLLGKRYKDKLDQDANDFINFAVDGANRMQRLINDLLEYSRVTSRGKPLEKLDLSSVLGRVIATMQFKIQDTNAMVSNEDLPFVVGDEIQISRVFQNLIDNALKFRGEEPPRIHISSKFESGKVIISVSDNGIGINEKFNDRVFTIFQRLHNREDYPGTGIGLAVCKRIIERHGGKIWLESEEGKGTTFYFTLNK